METLKHTRRPDVKIILNCAAEELFPVLPNVLPPGSETMNFVDYTPARTVSGSMPGPHSSEADADDSHLHLARR